MFSDEANQLGLFSTQVTDLDCNSKHNDPTTSVAAGAEMKASGSLSRHHNLIISVLSERQQTNMEIAAKTHLTQNQVTRRMTELERRGIAKRGRIVTCPYLQRQAGTWRIV